MTMSKTEYSFSLKIVFLLITNNVNLHIRIYVIMSNTVYVCFQSTYSVYTFNVKQINIRLMSNQEVPLFITKSHTPKFYGI